MRVLYRDTADTGTSPATAIDPQAGTDDDRVLKKIIVGKPVDGATITVYNINNAYTGATTNIAFKATLDTASTSLPRTAPVVIDLTTSAGGQSTPSDGIVLGGGGSVTTSSAMQVSFLWDYGEA